METKPAYETCTRTMKRGLNSSFIVMDWDQIQTLQECFVRYQRQTQNKLIIFITLRFFFTLIKNNYYLYYHVKNDY